MCECLLEIPKKLVQNQPLKGKVVTVAEVSEATFVYSESKNNMDMRTYSDVELQVEGKKRPVTQKMLHTFCPFCGVKYEFDE